MKSASTHFHIKWLDNYTALIGPVMLQFQDHALESFNIDIFGAH